MSVYHARKTLELINNTIKADQGSSFRGWLEQVIPHICDAYRTDEFPFRSHMGASSIGDKCGRKIWYSFRWSKLNKFDGKLLRLFNRGHLEEARFVAMLLMIGCEVYQQDANGNQFRISDANGHFGGSGDGIIVGIPDLPPGTRVLGEFKTSNDKNFVKLEKEGLLRSKFVHYVQMQIYMRKMNIPVGLYMVVNKNNDALYAELVPADPETAEQYLERANKLVGTEEPPEKISKSPGWFECKWCDFSDICHKNAETYKTCRSCANVKLGPDGTWLCTSPDVEASALTQEQQFAACNSYKRKF